MSNQQASPGELSAAGVESALARNRVSPQPAAIRTLSSFQIWACS